MAGITDVSTVGLQHSAGHSAPTLTQFSGSLFISMGPVIVLSSQNMLLV